MSVLVCMCVSQALAWLPVPALHRFDPACFLPGMAGATCRTRAPESTGSWGPAAPRSTGYPPSLPAAAGAYARSSPAPRCAPHTHLRRPQLCSTAQQQQQQGPLQRLLQACTVCMVRAHTACMLGVHTACMVRAHEACMVRGVSCSACSSLCMLPGAVICSVSGPFRYAKASLWCCASDVCMICRCQFRALWEAFKQSAQKCCVCLCARV